jgi:tetratricopeptide (TPR) repeat protein
MVGHAAPRAEEVAKLDGAEAHRLELVREQSLEIVRESLELVRESLENEEHDEPELDRTARVETLTFAVAEAPSSDFDDPADDVESVNAATVTPVKAESRASHVTSLPTPEEMSIPPVGDLSVEPIADRFFSEGELVAARADHEAEEWDERANKAVRKSLPEVVQRRARFAKYVRWAVGGAAVLCLAAVARSALPPSAPPSSGASASLSQGTRLEAPASKAASVAVVAPAAPAVVAAEPVTTAEPVSAPVVAVPAAVAPAAAPEPAAAAPVAAAPADAPAAPAVATSDKSALQEKNDSRRALERGKLADAIAAGERSVALDPTDGEAWLLLGAAYQEKGKNADARRCYSSCVKEGKRGPLGECRALIH